MNQQLLIQVSEGLLFFVASIGLVLILLASVYDLRAIARRRYLRTIVTKLRKPRQPHITVLVYAKNSGATIEACLRSISRSTYKNYDIVVVDNVSTDMTKQVMARYRQKHPTQPLYFYAKRKTSNQLLSLQQGYKKSQRGDSILVLDTASTITSTLLKECVVRFIANDALGALRLNEHINEVQSITLLWLRFIHLSRNIYAKSASLLSVGHITIGESNIMYSRLVFTRQQYGPKVAKVLHRYEGSLIVSTMPVPQFRSASLSLSVMWWGLFTPVLFLLTYFLYIAATLQSSSLLTLSWLILAIWLVVAVLSDEASRIKEKIGLIFCIPVFYFLLYVQLVIYGTMRMLWAIGSVVPTWAQLGHKHAHLAERRL